MPTAKNDYGIFTECNLMGINEGLGATVAVYGTLIGLAVVGSIIDSKKRKKEMDAKEKERAEAYKAECKKRHNDNLKFAEDAKKYYNISDIDEIESGSFKTDKDVFDSMLKDCKAWTKKIINSQAFKDSINEIISDESTMDSISSEYYSGYKASLSGFKSVFKVEEGINGWKESIQVLDGSQTENICLGWVCYDLARLIEIKYKNYVGSVGIGDGDEGHLYYQISM